MLQSIIHTSENNNFYLYNDKYRLSMLIHPELQKAHEAVPNVGIDPYYMKKYTYLKDHGFFSEANLANFNTVVSESKVKESIIQTPQILFEVTDFCNLKCTYCALGELYEWGENRNSKNLSIDSAISLLKYILDLKLQYKKHDLVISFYGGEPLLNIKFIKQIVETVHNLNPGEEIKIGYNMTTNGILIDKHIDFFVKNNFNILVSLDGNEENNGYRIFYQNNKSSFRKVIDNMDMIQKDYPEYFANKINFNAVLHNKNSVKDIYEFIYNRYHKIPQISELNNVGVHRDKKHIFKNMFQEVRESEAQYSKEKENLLPHNELISYHELTNFLKYLSVNSYISDIVSVLHNEDKYFPTSTCLPFSKKIFLTTSNKLLPCEKINYKYLLGEINKEVIIDIQKIAQRYTSYYEYLQNKCQNCYVYRFCGLCMFHLNNFDKLDSEEFVCNFFHDQNAFKSKLYRVFSFLEKHPNDFFEILEDVVIIS